MLLLFPSLLSTLTEQGVTPTKQGSNIRQEERPEELQGHLAELIDHQLGCTTSTWPSFGLRQPFPPPSAVSEDFAMDCIIGLPAY